MGLLCYNHKYMVNNRVCEKVTILLDSTPVVSNI